MTSNRPVFGTQPRPGATDEDVARARAVARQALNISAPPPAKYADVADFWNKNAAPTGYPFLTEDMRNDMYREGMQFGVVAVRWKPNAGKFGPQWYVDIDLNGQMYTYTASPNEARDAKFTEMQTFLEQTGTTLPAMWRTFDTDYGNVGWDIVQPYEVDPAMLEDVPF